MIALIAAAGIVVVGISDINRANFGTLAGVPWVVPIVLGVLAIGGYLPWLDSRTDEVVKARDWLNAHLSFMRNW